VGRDYVTRRFYNNPWIATKQHHTLAIMHWSRCLPPIHSIHGIPIMTTFDTFGTRSPVALQCHRLPSQCRYWHNYWQLLSRDVYNSERWVYSVLNASISDFIAIWYKPGRIILFYKLIVKMNAFKKKNISKLLKTL